MDGGKQERNAAGGQPFATIRAGAEADYLDRRHSDDARRAQRFRSACSTQMRATAIVREAQGRGSICCKRLAHVSSWPCAPKARITCGGGIHPESCRLIW